MGEFVEMLFMDHLLPLGGGNSYGCYGGEASTQPHPPSRNGSIPSSPAVLSCHLHTDINSRLQDGFGARLESQHPEELRQEDHKFEALQSEFKARLGSLLIVSISN